MRTTRSSLAVAALGSLLLTAACTSTQFPPPQAGGPGGAIGLETLDSCDSLLGYLKTEAAERVTAWGLEGMYGPVMMEGTQEDSATSGGAESAGGGSDGSYSGTNNQVEGVDEADVVKTNGEVIVTSISGAVKVVDVATAEVLATIRAPGTEDAGSELLLDGDDLVILSTQWHGWHDGATGGERTSISRVDLSDPANPELVSTTRLEGSYRTARMIDGTVRLVMVSQPPGLAFTYPEDGSMSSEAEALEANRQVIADSTIHDWLPHMQSVDPSGAGGTPELLLDCTAVGRPGDVSGFATVSVLTLAPDGSTAPTSAAGVLGTGDTVYASTDRVIVATNPWWSWFGDTASDGQTDLHSFDISDPGATTYVASGRVEGWLLNQFSMDESDGVIRVATTLTPPSAAEPSSSSLVVLTEDGDELVETGRVDGLGETEQIYSVRYLGPDLAAVVTFRQTDPLYLIDTSDPAAPRTLGELKIPGYSSYLHPLGDGLLLGVGQDATEEGRTTGLQASLLDISDPTAPERVGQVSWPDTSSTAEYDHRAFLFWENRIYLPAETWSWQAEEEGEEVKPQIGIVTADLDGASLAEGPRIDTGGASDPWAGAVIRVFVAGGDLWALGYSDLYRYDLETLDGGPVAVV